MLLMIIKVHIFLKVVMISVFVLKIHIAPVHYNYRVELYT